MTAENAGAVLRDARIAKSMSILDAAKGLRISVDRVKLLEAGQVQDFGGAVYVNGYLRRYAELLSLDPQPLIQAMRSGLTSEPVILPPGAETPLELRSQHRLPEPRLMILLREYRWVAPMAVGLVLALLALLTVMMS